MSKPGKADKAAKNNEQVMKLVRNMTLFDDTLMSRVFDKNIEATELLLKIILERDDIKVKSVKGQYNLKSPYMKGRSLILDIHAVDGNGAEFDVEVQRSTRGSHIKRARYHGSMLDARMLKKNQDFRQLNDSYVIFICQHDKFKMGLPVYHLDKIIRETGKKIDDGSHIIYFNGKYRGNDAFGKLAHDFNCKQSRNINYSPFAEGVKHFKETEKGVRIMCESVQKYARQMSKQDSEKTRIETKIDDLKCLMETTSITLEQAMQNLRVNSKDRAIIMKRLQP